MQKSNNFDVVIIGGGASGLMCAISAKQKNKNISVAIIEKNDRVGKKLLSTGNGRCNLTHTDITAEKYCGSFKNQSNAVFEKYDTKRVLDIFKKLGLLTFCDNEGRYYPLCKQASAVLDVLRFACERLNVEIFCGENIRSIKRNNGCFSVKTDENEFVSKKLVIANGSKAAPKLGGNSSSADYLKNFGITTLLDSKTKEESSTDRQFSSLVLGGMSYGISPLEIAAAYGALANGGNYIEPTVFTTITTYDGNLLVKANP
ncbi:MAG: NAD(P)/FAD-dependent oxidoreductase, partial [Ruminococcus sp.]